MRTKKNKKSTSKPLHLTEKFTRAVDYARQIHVENRKETLVPYMAHLMGVAALVMGENGYVDFPIAQDMVIAALLHDAVEDQGGMNRLCDIRTNFGEDVARIVEGCTDSFVEDSENKPPWHERKRAYLKRLRKEPLDVQLVSAADKLYNARAMLEDYRLIGDSIFARFKRGREDQLWYFKSLIKAYEASKSNRIVDELKRVVGELDRISCDGKSAAGTPS
jgi:(p)ppGpp synthase/HD superfamily hydrolase